MISVGAYNQYVMNCLQFCLKFIISVNFCRYTTVFQGVPGWRKLANDLADGRRLDARHKMVHRTENEFLASERERKETLKARLGVLMLDLSAGACTRPLFGSA